MKYFIPFCLFFLFSIQSFSANLDWEQEVDYHIKVTLQPELKLLTGEIEIHYTNHSKTHLDTIWLHLWPNAYSKYNTALAKQLLLHDNMAMDVLDRSEMGGINDLNVMVDGQPAILSMDEQHQDIAFIVLNSPILPEEKIVIQTPFKVKVPASVSRLGTDGVNFSITQWFPKVAVFDEEGWHPMPYLELGEYYADFGKYSVEISVPEKYIVAATGIQQSINSTNGMTTYRFEQDNIHDFAWFASPDFMIKTDVVLLPNGHEVTVNTYHVTESEVWTNCNNIIKNSLIHFSEWIGPYPYSHCTVVEGLLEAGNGMEYPMITVIQNEKNTWAFEKVVAHEVAHNWWQGMLASNERQFPWIDEGFTSYYEKRYTDEEALYYKDPFAFITERKIAKFFGIEGLDMQRGEELLIQNEQRLNRHQIVGSTSETFTYSNYAIDIYAKAPKIILYLENYLGQSTFDGCIQSFFQSYRFRHISPVELQIHFEECSGKDLDFVFEDWINTDGTVDAQIKSIQHVDESIHIEIQHKGDFALPVPVTITTADGEQTFWTDGLENSALIFSEMDYENIVIDPTNLTLDIQPANNSYKSKGFHKIERIHPQLFFGLEDIKKSQFYFSPMIGLNGNDNFMLGMTFYNQIFPVKPLKWTITPLYAFGTKQVNGIFNLEYTQNIKKDRRVQLTYGNYFKTFSYNDSDLGVRYINLRPSITANILSKDRNKKKVHQIQWKHHQVWKELNTQAAADAPIVKIYSPRWVEEIRYGFSKDDIKTPINAEIKFQFNNEHARTMASTDFKVRYGKINSYFSGRFWMGAMLAKRNEFATSSNLGYPTYAMNLSGQSGIRDYLFEHSYRARSASEGLFSRQIFMNEGQFKFANSDNLLSSNILASSINLRADFPSKWIPIKLFADFGLIYTNRFNGGNLEASSLFVFQAGAMISLFNEVMEFYFPLISSSDIKDFYKLQNITFKRRIAVAIDLEKLNPQKLVKDFGF
jgi:hypothetical protein